MTQLRLHNPIGKYRHLVNQPWNLPLKVSLKTTTIAVGRPDNKQNRCRTGEECECEELRLRKGFAISCGIMGFASSSVKCNCLILEVPNS